MTKKDEEIMKVRRTGTSNAVTIPDKPVFQKFRDARYLRLSIRNEGGRPLLVAELLEEVKP